MPRIMTATPPMAPPTIAPIGGLLSLPSEGVEEGEGEGDGEGWVLQERAT